jgi:hypothetical protein
VPPTAKEAVTVLVAALKLILQPAFPEHAPDQPENRFEAVAVSLSVTAVPGGNVAVQPVAEPVVQLIPDGLLVTVPVPVPDMATVRESLVEPEVDDGGTRPWQPASRVVSANSDTQPTEACLKRYASESGESLMDPAASWLDNFSRKRSENPDFSPTNYNGARDRCRSGTIRLFERVICCE